MPHPVATRTNDRATRNILDCLRIVVRELRTSARQAEAALGISGAQLFVLEKLSASPEAISLSELSRRTLTHQSTLSVVVTRLTERGLISRNRSEEDRRRVLITLTKEGRKLLSNAPAAAQHRLIDAIGRLDPIGRRSLGALLEQLIAGMGARGTPPLFFEDEPKKGQARRARA